MSTTPEKKLKITDQSSLNWYYKLPGSRFAYEYLLYGSRHFPYYDKPFTWCFPPWYKGTVRMEQEYSKTLNLPKGSTLFEAGMGESVVARTGAAEFGHTIMGVDYTPRHIELSKKHIAKWEKQGLIKPGQIQIFHGDYHHLETFSDECVDGAYACEALSHAQDLEKAIAELFRLTKPGGRIVFCEYFDDLSHDSPDPEVRRLAERMDMINKYASMPTNARSRPGFYQKVLEDAGYIDCKTEDLSLNVRPFVFWMWLLLGIPHRFVQFFGLEKYFCNVIVSQMWWGKEHWRYCRVSGTKPGELPKNK